jgi:hypothetical protein
VTCWFQLLIGLKKVINNMRQADIRYKELFKELQNILKELKLKLDQHKRDFKENPNWSFVDDIEYINRQLKLITEFV